jgi:hypothetical protein
MMAGTKNPIVVCLCGSTRFKPAFDYLRAKMTLGGKIVLGPDVFTESGDQWAGLYEGNQEADLEALHRVKIDMADAVFVVNPGNYISESTRADIAYAISTGKPVYYHEEWYEPEYNGDETFWQATNYPLPTGLLQTAG